MKDPLWQRNSAALTGKPAPGEQWCIVVWIAVLMAMVGRPAAAASGLRVSGLAPQPATSQWIIQFFDTAPGTAADYSVEARTNLATDVWTILPSVITSTGPTNWQATVAVPAALHRAFFRISRRGEPITISFQTTFAGLEEGDPAPGLTLLLPEVFSGTLNYEVSFLDGNPPTPLSVVVSDATEVFLPIPVADDEVVSPSRQLTVRLLETPGGGYNVDGVQAVSLTLFDNDSLWDGVLENATLGIPFTLRLLSSQGSASAQLSSEGLNILPTGDYPVSGFSLTISNHFNASVGPLSLPSDRTPTRDAMSLQLVLTATQGGGGGQSVEADLIGGNYLLVVRVPGKPHLTQTLSGPFQLFKRTLPATSDRP